MAKQLKRTKNSIVMQGVIGNLKPTEKVAFGFTSGVKDGVAWKKVKLSLKTSKGNMVFAELYGQVRKTATFYNNSTKQSKQVAWKDRFTYNESGFKLMMPDYDLIEEMERVLVEGMSVKMRFQYAAEDYVNKTGQPVKRNYLRISGFEPIDALDMNDPNFEELNYVNMDVIIKKVTDAPSNTLVVDGFIIDSFNKPRDIQLIAENADEMYGLKSLRYGTKITIVNGKYKNSREQEEVVVQNKAGFGKSTVVKYEDKTKVGIYFDTVDASEIIEGMYSPEDIAAANEGVVAKPEATHSAPVAEPVVVSSDDIDDDDLDLEL